MNIHHGIHVIVYIGFLFPAASVASQTLLLYDTVYRPAVEIHKLGIDMRAFVIRFWALTLGNH
jgi:hypothetical protein